jgi:hypothetical protein
VSNVPLSESASGITDANGECRVSLGPLRSFEVWNVISTTVANTGTALVPTAKLYRGGEAPSRLIDGTYTGTLDTTDTAYSLRSGEKVVAVFTGASVGTQCTVTVEGTATR